MKIPVRLALALFLVASAARSADDPVSLVKYRQSVMKSLGAHMSSMSLVVKKKVSRRTQLAAHAEAIRGLCADIPALFPAGTSTDKVPTAALPAVWKQPQKFAASSQSLERESAKLVALARKGDVRGFDAQFEKVSATCNACHETFRQRESD
jgi:cytochrome c556